MPPNLTRPRTVRRQDHKNRFHHFATSPAWGACQHFRRPLPHQKNLVVTRMLLKGVTCRRLLFRQDAPQAFALTAFNAKLPIEFADSSKTFNVIIITHKRNSFITH
jgi:hypothetical protein